MIIIIIAFFKMDLFSFMKKSTKNNQQTLKPVKGKSVTRKQQRFQTQHVPLRQYHQSTIQTQHNNEIKVTEMGTQKYKINAKQLLDYLWKLKTLLEEEYDQILKLKASKIKSQIATILMQTKFFKFQQVTQQSLLQRCQKLIQGCQLLISKLKNNQSIKDNIYVKNSQEFLMFFKSLFGKPYTFCNMLSNRKILELLWQTQLFKNKKITRGIQNCKLWIYGISLPSNPADINFHKLVLKNPELISKVLKMKQNNYIYLNVNRSDCNAQTPIMVASRANNIKAIQKLIKNQADPFLCPLSFTVSKAKRIKQKRLGKTKILIETPLKQRKQPNCIQHFFQIKNYKAAANIFYFEQIKKIKLLKKCPIAAILKFIPDCSFQIDWRGNKSLLNFKQIPKDIISIYKKGSNLRIDYHIDSLQSNKLNNNQHFSLLFKGQKPQFYLINHHQKKITDLLHEVNSQVIKERYETYLYHGNLQNQQIISAKLHYNSNFSMQVSINLAYQNIKNYYNPLSSVEEYEKQIIKSNLINYQILQASELKSVVQENICQIIPDVKSKIIKSSINLDIEWKKQIINLKHIELVMILLCEQFPLIKRLVKIISLFNDEQLKRQQFMDMLPYKIKFNMDSDNNISLEIKNITPNKVNSAVFQVDYRAKQNDYDKLIENEDIGSLQSTVVLDEMYSLNVSNFLGKTERLMQYQDEEANARFQQLLTSQINKCYDSDQDN